MEAFRFMDTDSKRNVTTYERIKKSFNNFKRGYF